MPEHKIQPVGGINQHARGAKAMVMGSDVIDNVDAQRRAAASAAVNVTTGTDAYQSQEQRKLRNCFKMNLWGYPKDSLTILPR